MDLFCEMIQDRGVRVRIEAPEMFRVMGKRKPQCVKPYLEKLQWFADNDTNPVVRIHSAGAIRITKKHWRNSRMPQMTKGGKYIFGWSRIRVNGELIFPRMEVDEYKLKEENHIYIVSGSKQTGGFSVMTEPLLSHSTLKNVLEENPSLADRSLSEGELIAYKGRKYGWLSLKENTVYLSNDLMKMLEIKVGDKLLAIRSSDIAFTMGVKGSLIEKANGYRGIIEEF